MLGELLGLYMRVNNIEVRPMALILDVSPATVSRITQGRSVSQDVILKLVNWLFNAPQPKPGEGEIRL